MGLRTIEAPGVEIKEIDKSDYTPAMTGTRCYIMGYASKGEPFAPMEFTSKTAWQTYYGDPGNEAERYFYNACSEVINQNGVLYCARIPYDNDSYGKMVGFKYNVGLTPKKIPTSKDYLTQEDVFHVVKHNAEYEYDALKYVIENNIYRNIDGDLSGDNELELDDKAQYFFNTVLDEYKKQEQYGRYKIAYYVFNQDESLKANFNSKNKSEDFIKDYEDGKFNIPGEYIYKTHIQPKSDNDFDVYIYKYDYREKVIESDLSTILPESSLTVLTGDVEISESESDKIVQYLKSADPIPFE
jgi:hypothetical protein